jgi:hypothetical protein
MDACHVGVRCHLGVHANGVTLVRGRIQVVPMVSDSDGSLVNGMVEAVTENGLARDKMTGDRLEEIGFS